MYSHYNPVQSPSPSSSLPSPSFSIPPGLSLKLPLSGLWKPAAVGLPIREPQGGKVNFTRRATDVWNINMKLCPDQCSASPTSVSTNLRGITDLMNEPKNNSLVTKTKALWSNTILITTTYSTSIESTLNEKVLGLCMEIVYEMGIYKRAFCIQRCPSRPTYNSDVKYCQETYLCIGCCLLLMELITVFCW